MWSDIVTLLRESVLVQGLVTLMLLSVVCYAAVANVPLSNQFWVITGSVMGFWFGSKTQAGTNETLRHVDNISREV